VNSVVAFSRAPFAHESTRSFENKHPAGGVFHAASFDDAGDVHVADVWESVDALSAFAQTALMPAFAKHNIAPPTVSVYPTHEVLAYASVDKYQASISLRLRIERTVVSQPTIP
jgi:hypothetical protein